MSPTPKVSDKNGFITQTMWWGFVAYLKVWSVRRVLKDFTLKSLVWVKVCVNCWQLKFIVQEVHPRWILVWQCLGYKETHSTAISLPPFPVAGPPQWWQYWMAVESSRHAFHGNEKKSVLSASSPPSSSQWHWKGEEKITEHKLRERRWRFRWKSSWCSPTCSPLLALALLAEGLPGFYLISASELDVLRVTWQLLVWPVPLSHCVSRSYRKAATAFPFPAGSWALERQSW